MANATEESVLVRAIERMQNELNKLKTRKSDFKQNIESLKKSIARLEAKGSRVIALLEYRKLRMEAVRCYKDLAQCELEIRNMTVELRKLTRDLRIMRTPKPA